MIEKMEQECKLGNFIDLWMDLWKTIQLLVSGSLKNCLCHHTTVSILQYGSLVWLYSLSARSQSQWVNLQRDFFSKPGPHKLFGKEDFSRLLPQGVLALPMWKTLQNALTQKEQIQTFLFAKFHCPVEQVVNIMLVGGFYFKNVYSFYCM